MTARSSPYAKMYLVSPAVYEKLLKCIDDSDKALTESMNPDVDVVEEKRPSEIALEQLHREELDPSAKRQKITPEMLSSAISSVKTTLPSIPEYDEDMPSSQSFIQQPLIDTPIQPILPQPMLPPPSPIRPATFIPPVQNPLIMKPQIARPIVESQPSQIAANISPPTKCVTTRRGTICSIVAPTTLQEGRVSKASKNFRFYCTQKNCDKSYSRKFDLKKHMLEKHGVEPEESYKRYGIQDPDETLEQQGVKRTLTTAGIKNLNPTKVTRVEPPEQSGSGCFPSWN